MKTYWDLSNKEQAALEHADMEPYIKLELMSRGVGELPSPKLKCPEKPEVPQGQDFYEVGNLVFVSQEDANLVAAMNKVQANYNYRVGSDVKYFEPVDYYNSVTKQNLLSREQYATVEKALAAYNEQKAAYEEEQKEYSENADKTANETREIWHDYHEKRQLADRLKLIIDVYKDYIETCEGNADMAFNFLVKRFPDPEEVVDAFEWFELDIPRSLEVTK